MKLLLFTTSLFALLFFASCVDSVNSSTDTTLSTDAQIKSFSFLAKDSISKNLDKVFFSINQNDGLIQNFDSLPVSAGTNFAKYKYKFIKVKMEFAGASKVMIEYGPDLQFEYPKVDSIDFTRPVKIQVTAVDGKTIKSYEFKLNIHTQDPEVLDWKQVSFDGWNAIPFSDSKTVVFKGEFWTYLKSTNGYFLYTSATTDGAVWQSRTSALFMPTNAEIETITLFANKLYLRTSENLLISSSDGLNWSKLGGAAKNISAIYGSIVDQSAANHLIVLTEENGVRRFASVSDAGDLTICGDAIIPDDFPVSGFATINKIIGLTEKLTLIAGRDKNGNLLNSVQQLYWDNSGFHCGYNMENGKNWFPVCESPNAYYYDSKMIVSCGRELTKENKNTYFSTNYGLSWAKDTTHLYPTAFVARANSSVVVDSKNYIWIFGGQNKFVNRPAAGINEIWRGRLNRLGFVRQ
ncbi:MAG: DUF6242 domain-containing protein [Bacteroidales bacterium]